MSRTTHGLSGTKEHKRWSYAKKRCYNPKYGHYMQYGGRGIKMCTKWKDSFEQFLKDMGPCPEGYTLDRIDTNGDYKPSNCRWASWKTQCRNKTNNIYLTYNGKSQIMFDWAREWNIKPKTLSAMLKRKTIKEIGDEHA